MVPCTGGSSFRRPVTDNTELPASGKEGMKDSRIIEAIKRAADARKKGGSELGVTPTLINQIGLFNVTRTQKIPSLHLRKVQLG